MQKINTSLSSRLAGMKAMVGTLVATAALAAGVQAAVPASAAALPRQDATTCGRFFDNYISNWQVGNIWMAKFWFGVWEYNCVDEDESGEGEP